MILAHTTHQCFGLYTRKICNCQKETKISVYFSQNCLEHNCSSYFSLRQMIWHITQQNGTSRPSSAVEVKLSCTTMSWRHQTMEVTVSFILNLRWFPSVPVTIGQFLLWTLQWYNKRHASNIHNFPYATVQK